MYPTVRVKKSGKKVWLDKSFPVTDEQLALGFEQWQHRLPTDKRYTNAVQYKGRYYVPRYVLKSAIEEEVKRRFNLGYDDFKIENTKNAFNAFRHRGWDIEFVKNFKWPVRRPDRGLCIAGTRITLYSIMDYVKAGHPPEMIRDHFRLTIKQTADVLKYIEDYQEKFAEEYQQVLEYSEEIRQYWEERNRERFAQIAALPPKPGQEKIREKLQAAKQRLGME